jgi:uncharacterized delta-60 repeat protein
MCLPRSVRAQGPVEIRQLDAGTTGDKQGISPCLAIVDGRPAAAWMNQPLTTVKYVRALDADGSTWGEPVILYSKAAGEPASSSGKLNLLVVNGRPAVCFSRAGTTELTWLQAEDAAGSQWKAPVKIQLLDTEVAGLSMDIADGKPALVYSAACCGEMRYVSALDADGSAWGAAKVIKTAPGATFADPVMRNIGGRPVVVASSFMNLWRMDAQDAAGTAWTSGVLWNADVQNLSMCEVTGSPAMVLSRSVPVSQLFYWGPPGVGGGLTFEGVITGATSIAVVKGKPAAAYKGPAGLVYVESADDKGVSWGSPFTVSGGTQAQAIRLLEVNGSAAMVFTDPGGLRYLRISPVVPPLDVEVSNGQEVVVRRGSVEFGRTRTSFSITKPLTVKNIHPLSANLILQSVAIDGRDASEFTIFTPPVNVPVPATLTTQFSVVFVPRASPGRKTAVLHINTNGVAVPGPYDIVLNADSFSNEIEVHRTGGRLLDSGSPLFFPPVPAGSIRDYSLTIGNPGTTALSGIAVTINGPDAADFSVTAPPGEVVPPGGDTSFTLRYAPATQGPKNAMLRIASSAADFTGPFLIPLKVVPGSPETLITQDLAGGALATAVTPGGGILLSTEPSSFTRLRPDGSPDLAFFDPVLDGPVQSIAALYNGKILIGGWFTTVNGIERKGLAQLEADGSLDLSFKSSLPLTVSCLIVQPDGKIVAAGNEPSTYLLRFLPDGSVDPSFTEFPVGGVVCLALEPDGHILAGGTFSYIGGRSVSRLARLDTFGAAKTFGSMPVQEVVCLAVQDDGRVIAGGLYPSTVSRFTPAGLPDAFPSFNFPKALAVQTDGTCLVGTLWEGLGRVLPSGLKDNLFLSAGSDYSARNVVIEADGSVLVAGDFPNMETVREARLVRFQNEPASVSLQATDGTTLRWLRSGTAPEVGDVTFQGKSASSQEWTLLGKGTRIAGGWELSGLTLSSLRHCRVLGRAGGSVMESLLTLPTPLESWRVQHFGISSSTGDAADDADPDHDGLTNFTEYAFGLSPVDRASNVLPLFVHNGTSFTATFTAPGGRDDILYSAGWSATMQPGTWTNIPDTGTGGTHVFTIPGTLPRVFVRYKASMR